jgi:exodeoxyribonuclease VII small subunit
MSERSGERTGRRSERPRRRETEPVIENALPLFASDEVEEKTAEMTFEEAYAALEETVRQLERGDSGIDDLVALYERGTALAKLCNARLDAAELRISQLSPTPDGGYAETEFED